MIGPRVLDSIALRRVARSSTARRLLLVGMTSALGSAGCDGSAGVVATEATRQIQVQVPMSVTVSPSSGTIAVGGTLQLEAEVRDQFGQPMVTTVRWRSSNPDVGTVSPTGLLMGQAPGVVSVTARAGVLIGPTGSGTYAITVAAPPPGPPGAVTDLAITGAGNTSLTLSFTEVGDGAGAPADYEVRFRNAGSGSWDNSLLALNGSCAYPVEGNAVGAQRTCVIEGLESGRSYDVQVAAFREGGGSPVVGAPSNTATGSTSSAPPPPTNSSPAAPTLSVTAITTSGATLNGTAFSDPNPEDSHGASEWQVAAAGASWATLVATSGVTTTDRTSWTVSGLQPSTGYQARMRYQDGRGAWSDWSSPQTFTTSETPPPPPPNSPPMSPSLSVSAVTASGATLIGSAFSDPDSGDTHSASEWQVDEQGGDWSSLVANSGVDGTNLTSFTAAGLTSSTGYQARVRYRDSNNTWSAWSNPQSFTTTSDGGGGVSFLFTSDWSTSTGNSAPAVRDGTRWADAFNYASPTAERVTVLPAAGLGFPAGMVNVLAIRYEASISTFSGVSSGPTAWPLPPVGGVLARRMYFRHNIEGTNSATHHPVQSAYQAGSCAYAAEWNMDKGDTFRFQLANLRDGSPHTNMHRWETTLSRGTTYRIEERYERASETTWRLHIRIYDSSNNLVRQDADFLDTISGVTLAAFNAAGGTIDTPNPSCLQSMLIVNQGVGSRGSDDPDANRLYYGGLAVCLGMWCGAYVPGEGR